MKKNKSISWRRFLFTLVFIIGSTAIVFGQAQEDGMTRKGKALKLYQSAQGMFHARKYKEAIKDLNKAIGIDKYFVAAYDLKVQCQYANRDKMGAINTYRTMVNSMKADTKQVKETYGILGELEYEQQEFDSAIVHLNTFLTFENVRVSLKDNANKFLASAKFSKKAMANPVNFKPINLGENINSKMNDYFPGITLDGETFIFTRLLRNGAYGANEDFFVSKKVDGEWGPAKNLGDKINTDQNEGSVSVTANGKYIFFTCCNRPRNIGSCDLYFSKYENGVWGPARMLPRPINSPNWESQPSIAPDGRTIYFTSNRPGGYGNRDIWVATLQNGRIENPKNLGPTINTNGGESTPFIHADGKTLYFTSDKHPGMGGADIFVSVKDDEGNWSEPVNLGYPINSVADEKGIIVDRMGKLAYMTSARKGGFGGLDIYQFELPEKVRANPVSYVKGYVYDKKTNLPLGTTIDLSNVTTGENILTFESDSVTGRFFIILESHKDYGLTIDKLGYLFHSENFSLTQTSELKPYELSIGLSKPENGESIVLKNVLFDTDKFNLKEASTYELKKVIKLLTTNSTMKIQISGHTDNKGSESHNKTLSANRAKSVVDYLIANGISSSRLTYKGYGSSKPIATNDTKEGREKNRRTELVIL